MLTLVELRSIVSREEKLENVGCLTTLIWPERAPMVGRFGGVEPPGALIVNVPGSRVALPNGGTPVIGGRKYPPVPISPEYSCAFAALPEMLREGVCIVICPALRVENLFS